MFYELRYFWISLSLLVLSFSACSTRSERATEDPTSTPQERHTTVLPPEFQAQIVGSNGKEEDVMLVARKGEKVRFDLNMGPGPRISRLKLDRCYTIDHATRTYSVFHCMFEQQTDESTRLFGDLGGDEFQLFRTTPLEGLTITERGNGYTTYRQGLESRFDYELITVDDASGMKVKTEFPNLKGQMEQGSLRRYKIELRDLQFKVDDSVFDIPSDYQAKTF